MTAKIIVIQLRLSHKDAKIITFKRPQSNWYRIIVGMQFRTTIKFFAFEDEQKTSVLCLLNIKVWRLTSTTTNYTILKFRYKFGDILASRPQ